jgi:hypothetical protein
MVNSVPLRPCVPRTSTHLHALLRGRECVAYSQRSRESALVAQLHDVKEA